MNLGDPSTANQDSATPVGIRGLHRPSFALVPIGKGTRTAGNKLCVIHHRVKQLPRTSGTAFTASHIGVTKGYQLLTNIQPLLLPPAPHTPLKMS